MSEINGYNKKNNFFFINFRSYLRLLLPRVPPHSVTAAWWLRLCRGATSEWYAEWVTHTSDAVQLRKVSAFKHKRNFCADTGLSSVLDTDCLLQLQHSRLRRQRAVLIKVSNARFQALLCTSTLHKQAYFNSLLFTLPWPLLHKKNASPLWTCQVCCSFERQHCCSSSHSFCPPVSLSSCFVKTGRLGVWSHLYT